MGQACRGLWLAGVSAPRGGDCNRGGCHEAACARMLGRSCKVSYCNNIEKSARTGGAEAFFVGTHDPEAIATAIEL